MAISLSSLTSSFSSLTFSLNPSSKPQSLSFSRHSTLPISIVAPPKIKSSSAAASTIVASSSSSAVLASPVEAAETVDLAKYVKSRLPGGFAAQNIIATGRRKCAIARVVLQEGTGKFIINNRVAKEYLQGHPLWLQYIKMPLVTLGYESSYDVFVKAHGGGLSGQAQAICLGVARALLKVSEDHRPPLRKEGLLTRNSKVVERKKAGLKKARKAPQYSKRKALVSWMDVSQLMMCGGLGIKDLTDWNRAIVYKLF
ncbi:30S ribosomal protein S9, chloroplastic [Dionaea muscipula]